MSCIRQHNIEGVYTLKVNTVIWNKAGNRTLVTEFASQVSDHRPKLFHKKKKKKKKKKKNLIFREKQST